MYIALRWLIGLSLAMWMAVCSIDFYNERSKKNQYRGFNVNILKSENITKIERIKLNGADMNGGKVNSHEYETAIIHYAMFFAGALAVSVLNRKKEIIQYTRKKIFHINVCASKILEDVELKKTAINVSVALVNFLTMFWVYCKTVSKNYLLKRRSFQTHYQIHLDLMKKIKEYSEERRNLGKFLITAIRENRNIRMQYQMATMAKNRLLQHVEDTQKRIKENHCKYISFQNLYLITHQENIFLKARLKKVCKEKEEAEKNLLCLINEVYQSTNNELKAYCSRFIVKTRENLLNSDVNAEIQKFLQKSTAATSYLQSSSDYILEANPRISEIRPEDEILTPKISDAPKLKGLPGECIWTIKDKDGIIEKLYEYDYASDFDKGDTVRRIRKYSVYHDKDCLLDFANSKTALCDLRSESIDILQEQYIKINYPLTSHRFLTGSQAFQNFLKDNQNLVQFPKSYTTASICE